MHPRSRSTAPQPMRGFVEAMMAAEGQDGVLSLSLGHGFPWGDVPDSGARMLAVVDGFVVPDDWAVARATAAAPWSSPTRPTTPGAAPPATPPSLCAG